MWYSEKSPRAGVTRWTAIERYAAFRFHLGEDAYKKIICLAQLPAFVAALKEVVGDQRSVFRADDPDQKLTLDPNDPRKSLKYYYQVRSNLIHRGKAAMRDHHTLLASLRELHGIFGRVLSDEFGSASDRSSQQASPPSDETQRSARFGE